MVRYLTSAGAREDERSVRHSRRLKQRERRTSLGEGDGRGDGELGGLSLEDDGLSEVAGLAVNLDSVVHVLLVLGGCSRHKHGSVKSRRQAEAKRRRTVEDGVSDGLGVVDLEDGLGGGSGLGGHFEGCEER